MSKWTVENEANTAELTRKAQAVAHEVAREVGQMDGCRVFWSVSDHAFSAGVGIEVDTPDGPIRNAWAVAGQLPDGHSAYVKDIPAFAKNWVDSIQRHYSALH